MKNKNNIKQANSHAERVEPVFIHSLWRAGSTYLFLVFRRSASGYWCYQEPVHELAMYAKDDPDSLLSFVGVKMMHLRHPEIPVPYYLELFETWKYWRDHMVKSIIYDGYFEESCSTDLKNYLDALFQNSKGRPVVQECRTSCRIKALRESFNGVHLYLWRNPWDQWWSFKVSDYFDVACQLIVNAPIHPEVISRLRTEINFNEFHDDDISLELAYFDSMRLSAENSYLVFYLIWCLGLLEGLANASLLINIDSLSVSNQYKQETEGALSFLGVPGLEFSDCSVYQNHFTVQETTFFTRIEDRIHGLLLASGYSQQQINELLAQRVAHEPKHRLMPLDEVKKESLLRDAERAREIVIRYESAYSVRIRQNANLLENEKKRFQLLREEFYRHEQETASREQNLTYKISQYVNESNALFHSLTHKDQELNEKLLSAKLSAEHEMAEQVRLQGEREELLQQEHAVREKALRVEIDNLLYTLSHREKEFGEKLFATRYSAENEKAELQRIHNEHEQSIRQESVARENALRGEFDKRVEQEKALQRQFSDILSQYQHQYEQFRQSAAEFGDHLKQQLQAEQQACIQMKLELTALNADMDKMRSSMSWKITAPFRSLLDVLSPRNSKPISRRPENNGRYLEPCSIKSSDQTNESADKLILPERISMPSSEQLERTVIARTLDELLSIYDEQFVRSAYMMLLGRAPDPEGMRYYLQRLRRGISKMEIIAQIRHSAEGKVRNTDVAGMQEALKRYRWCKMPIIGSLLKIMGFAYREPDIQQRLRIIENQLAVVSDKSDLLKEIDKRIFALDAGNNTRFEKMSHEIKDFNSRFASIRSNECLDISKATELSPESSTVMDDNTSSILSKKIVFHSERPDEVIKELSMYVRCSSEAVKMTH